MFFDCVVASASTNESKNKMKSARMSENVENKTLVDKVKVETFLVGKVGRIEPQFLKFSVACSATSVGSGDRISVQEQSQHILENTLISHPKPPITEFFSPPPANLDIELYSLSVAMMSSLCEPPMYEFM
jgi:hypothetical protein